jgi:hypothetical protein
MIDIIHKDRDQMTTFLDTYIIVAYTNRHIVTHIIILHRQ